MVKSKPIRPGNYFFVFLPDRIAVSLITDKILWDKFRKTNDNWVIINGYPNQYFILEGSSINDICVIPIDFTEPIKTRIRNSIYWEPENE